MDYDFDWIDAFAEEPFMGNGCVVVHGAGGLDIPSRLALVRETSLSECAFLVPSDRADVGARYYLAAREIPMAGHPTIATVTSLILRGLVTPPATFTLELGGGVFEIGVDAAHTITMHLPAPQFGAPATPEEMAEIYGLSPADILGTPRITSVGNAFCVTVLRDLKALSQAALNHRALAAWQSRQAVDNPAILEPFLTVLDGQVTRSRLLLPPPNPPEDPFTGSATGALVAYLWHHGLIEEPRITAHQGAQMGRPGTGQAEALGPRTAPTGVALSGKGVRVMSGHLHL